MPLVKAICTNCGGKLEVDNNMEAAICPFCGTAYIVEKAIQKYNIDSVHADTIYFINNGNDFGKEQLLKSAETHRKLGNTKEAYEIYADFVKKFPDDERGWYGYTLVTLKSFFESIVGLPQNSPIAREKISEAEAAFESCLTLCSDKQKMKQALATELDNFDIDALKKRDDSLGLFPINGVLQSEKINTLARADYNKVVEAHKVFQESQCVFINDLYTDIMQSGIFRTSGDGNENITWDKLRRGYVSERIRDTRERAWIISSQRILDKALSELREYRRHNGLCIYCGGELKGLFTKTCSKCGRKKIVQE